MKQFLTLFFICFISLFAVGCSDTSTCYNLTCAPNDTACKQEMPKTTYRPTGEKLGVISYIVTVIQDTVKGSSEKIFTKIIEDSSFKNLVTACMMLFVAIYGISIALGIAQPSPMELVIRILKMAVIYYLLTSWPNFQKLVGDFFDILTTELSTIFTTAVVSSASGETGTTVTPMDVFNFIDDKVLGTLLSVRFAVIVGAMFSISGVGLIVGLLLFSVVLSYLWTVIMAVQIYIMAGIARALLYAISPVFIIFLLFNQTKPLFEGWIKQLINFSLQPVLLVGFMAFFNGVFFNYLDVMFKPGYKVCSERQQTEGQVVRLHSFRLERENEGPPKEPIQITEVMDMFTLFVVIMLGTIMVKMNQWAVQAASQLSEGGITFTNTMQSNAQMANNVTKGAGNLMRDAVGLKKGSPK
jgi:type IV secretory pathway VirB6-like protein